MIGLRKYQEEYKAKTHQAFNEGAKSIMNVLPTGTGKTTIFSSLTEDWLRNNEETLLTVHRIELVDQIDERLRSFGIKPGIIASGYEHDLSLPVQIGMIQSMNSEISWKPKNVIIDECHHSTAKSYQQLWSLFPEAKVTGFTATPVRLDKKGFDNDYDIMHDLYPSSWYFENNFLCPVKHYICHNITGDIKMINDEYDPADIARKMKNEKCIADVVAAYTRYSPNRRAVVFCVDIEHSKQVAKRFNDIKISAAHIDGEMDKRERKRIISDFEKGKIMVITNYDIVSEGFDIPAIESTILARRTKSLSFFIQAVGRCLRTAPGKQAGYVLDCASQWLDHGPAGANYEWSLEGDPDKAKRPLNRSKIFMPKKGGVSSILDVNESQGIELLAFEESLQRLLMFDKYVYESIENKQGAEHAIPKYLNWLEIQGINAALVDTNYCKQQILKITGKSISDAVFNEFAA